MTGNTPIDIVLPWVDEKDPAWEQKRKEYAAKEQSDYETSNVRFESWDNLHLWFRAIETCMPWVNRIFLITCGHVPPFLKLDHSKLRWVKHEDYIPEEYLEKSEEKSK